MSLVVACSIDLWPKQLSRPQNLLRHFKLKVGFISEYRQVLGSHTSLVYLPLIRRVVKLYVMLSLSLPASKTSTSHAALCD